MKKGIIIAISLVLLVGMIPAFASASEHSGMERMSEWGHFNYTSGSAVGKFVKFDINPTNGEIQNYAVNGTTIFSSITYENATQGDVMVNGANLFYYGMGMKLNWSNMDRRFGYMWRFVHSHDNPAGVLHIVVYGGDTITYKLADGLNAEKTGNHTITISGKISGILVFTGNANVNGNSIEVKLGTNEFNFGNYTYKGGSAVFIRTGAWHMQKQLKERIIKAISEGRVGGEIRVGKYVDFTNYTYGFHAKIQNMEKDRLKITVDSENHEGKVLMINVNKSDLQYDSSHKIVVKLDGNELRMTSENDVLAGGSEGKYAVIDNGNSVMILVYVPHFSEHTVDVESQSTSPIEVMGNPMYMGIIIAVVVIIIVAVVAIMKRR